MSDTSALLSGPELDATIATPSSTLDVSSIDRSLRAISQVESAWRLPELPDEVRLDLATNSGMDHFGVARFLSQLDKDVYNENDEDVVVDQQPTPMLTVRPSTATFNDLELSGFQEAQGIITSLRGGKQSQVLDGDAVQRWKLRAIEQGKINPPASGIVDSTWSPELEGVRRSMLWEDTNARFRGDRTGASPIGTVMKTLNDWTSPTGLMRAAVDLDLWWDTGQIGKELNSWGDKWRAVGDADGPLDFGKKLFDAMTGPIDDILVPVINMTLLFSGVGAGVNFARLGATGIKGAEALKAVQAGNRLYETVGVSKIIRPVLEFGNTFKAGNIAALGEQSWTATKLLNAGEGTRRALVGGKMAAWRSLAPVVGARGIVQTGMRLGVASQVENRLLPGYQNDSFALSDIPGVSKTADTILSNPAVTTIGELAFTPYNVFAPGTFTSGGRAAVSSAFKFLGTAPGRGAAGAVAGAAVGSALGDDAGDVLTGAAVGGGFAAGVPLIPKSPFRVLNYAPLANDQRVTAMFARAMQQALPEDEYASFEQGVAKFGLFKEMESRLGVDETGVQGYLAHMGITASIHRTASIQASSFGAVGTPAWTQRYLLSTNQLNSQIRMFDAETSPIDIATAIARKTTNNAADFKRETNKLLVQIEERPEVFAEMLASHNEMAQKTMQQLLTRENFPAPSGGLANMPNVGPLEPDDFDAMVEYVANTIPRMGKWGEYQAVTSELGDVVGAGLLTDARLKPVVAYMGDRELDLAEFLDDAKLDQTVADVLQHQDELIFGEVGVDAASLREAGGYVNPMAREINPSRSRVALQLLENPTKGDYLAAADEIDQHYKMFTKFDKAMATLRSTGQTASITPAEVASLSGAQLSKIMKAVGTPGTAAKEVKAVQRYLKRLAADGVDVVSSLDSAYYKYLDDLAVDPKWSRFKQSGTLTGDDGKVLTGAELLRHRAKQLRRDARNVAAELDIDDLAAKLSPEDFSRVKAVAGEAAERGYRVVYGTDFIMPDETARATGLFDDITARHLHAVTLGNFFSRRQPEALAANVRRARALGLSQELSKAFGETIGPEDQRVTSLIDDLYRHVLEPALEANRQTVEDIATQSMMGRVGTALKTNSQPAGAAELGLGRNRKLVVEALTKLGYDERTAAAAWQGIKAGRYAEFKDLGLYSMEAKLRGRNQLIDSLRVFSGGTEASKFKQALGGSAVGAAAGAVAGSEDGSRSESWLRSVATGAAVGAGVNAGITGKAFDKAATAVDYTKFARYGYLADNLAAMRDKMRFTLSPFFDLSRYTEAFVLGQIGAPGKTADGARLALPLNQSKKALGRSLEKSGENAAEILARNAEEWRAATRGRFDPLEVENTGRAFQQVGILGFNPTDWMESSFYHMRKAGMSPEEAHDAVRSMYTYGTRGRSAAEQSINFIFFPFSFQKKTVTAAAKWISDDLTRSVMLHDAYQAWQVLDEKYDLGNWALDHFPVLKKLQQLNMFAYGLSPGRLGGINAPVVDLVVGDPMSRHAEARGLAFNLFNPVGVNVGGPGVGGSKEMERFARSLVPVVNDVHYMIQDAKETGQAVFDPVWASRSAQYREASREWTAYKKGVGQALDEAGLTWAELYRKNALVGLRDSYLKKKRDLEALYPGWVEGKLQGQANVAELQQERQFRTNTVKYTPEKASVTDVQFVEFDAFLANEKRVLDQYGITEWEDAAPEDFDRIRAAALRMAAQNPSFEMVYNKFYQRDFGPLTTGVF
jgi:hypothetical protein